MATSPLSETKEGLRALTRMIINDTRSVLEQLELDDPDVTAIHNALNGISNDKLPALRKAMKQYKFLRYTIKQNSVV